MMKCKKGLVAGVVAVCMMGAMGVNAFASEIKNEADNNSNAATTNVKYDVTESYTWVVPSTIDFTSATDATVTTSGTSGDAQNAQVTKNVIAANKKLRITLDDSNTFQITSAENATLNYTVKVGNGNTALSKSGIVLDVPAGINSAVATLKFELKKDDVERAGNYKGSVTYKSELVDIDVQ